MNFWKGRFYLMKGIHNFLPVSDKEIPSTSIMRESVVGSIFKY